MFLDPYASACDTGLQVGLYYKSRIHIVGWYCSRESEVFWVHAIGGWSVYTFVSIGNIVIHPAPYCTSQMFASRGGVPQSSYTICDVHHFCDVVVLVLIIIKDSYYRAHINRVITYDAFRYGRCGALPLAHV